MDPDLEELVWSRAGSVCEYCRMPQALDELPFEVDHLIARVHGGKTIASNLALSCFPCNRFKGPFGFALKCHRLARWFVAFFAASATQRQSPIPQACPVDCYVVRSDDAYF
jgi:hypothetical protein